MVEMAALSTAALGLANKYGSGSFAALANQECAKHAQRHAAIRRQLNIEPATSFPAEFSKSMSKRLVRVFLVDPNPSVPLDASMLYKSEEKLTDLTDQELFFEIPVQELLTKHNAKRATLVDKEASKRSNKDVLLEAAKIRDLTMTVLVLETW